MQFDDTNKPKIKIQFLFFFCSYFFNFETNLRCADGLLLSVRIGSNGVDFSTVLSLTLPIFYQLSSLLNRFKAFQFSTFPVSSLPAFQFIYLPNFFSSIPPCQLSSFQAFQFPFFQFFSVPVFQPSSFAFSFSLSNFFCSILSCQVSIFQTSDLSVFAIYSSSLSRF